MPTQVTAAAGTTARPATPAGSGAPSAVVVAGLSNSYGTVLAVSGVSFTVEHGEIFALLGPNGAGKTTILEILEGYRTRDSGLVEVLGIDPGDRTAGAELRERIGLVLQDIAVEPYLTVRETIARNAGYYSCPREVGETIGLAGLAGLERKKVRNLSGGQKRRLDLALGLGAAARHSARPAQGQPAQPGRGLPELDRQRHSRTHAGREHPVSIATHPTSRRGLGLLWHQVRYEQLSFWRNPQSAFFTFVFPVVIITIFGALFRGGSGSSYFYGLSALQYYVPTIAALSVLSSCYSQIAIVLAQRRQDGILKRVRATPLPAWVYFLGLLAHCIVVSVVDVALIVGIGSLFSAPFPTHWAAIALALVLGAASFCALGVAVASLIRNSEAAPAVVQFVLFPLLFLSGTYMPIHSDVLNRISGALPVRPFNEALLGPFAQHTGFEWKDLGVLLAWGAAGALVAIRRFRWTPGPNDDQHVKAISQWTQGTRNRVSLPAAAAGARCPGVHIRAAAPALHHGTGIALSPTDPLSSEAQHGQDSLAGRLEAVAEPAASSPAAGSRGRRPG